MNNNDKPFSERMGLVPPKAMQTDDLDQAARTALYNVIYHSFWDKKGVKKGKNFWLDMEKIFLKMKVGELEKLEFRRRIEKTELDSVCDISENPETHLSYNNTYLENRYEEIFEEDWCEIIRLIEFIYFHMNKENSYAVSEIKQFLDEINNALKQENVGYRFIDGKFIPITNEEEVQAIEQATTSPYENARKNIKKAMNLFADRQNPDYVNSIKESISAVESLAVEITGENNFNKAIEKLKESGVNLHPQFEKAIKNMYQFTSDTVRHGQPTDKNLQRPEQNDQATAHYMLVVCSAIVNFIIASKTAKP